jgi:hypothetical protein
VSKVRVKFGRKGVDALELPLKMIRPPINVQRCRVVSSIVVYLTAGVYSINVNVEPVFGGTVKVVESDCY